MKITKLNAKDEAITKRSRANAHSPGRSLRNPPAAPTRLTNSRFMSKPQRAAHAAGEEIWV